MGSGTWAKIKSNKGCKFSLGSSNSFVHHPALPDAYKIGKSNCASVASKETNKSNTSSITSFGLPSGLSILLMTTIGNHSYLAAHAIKKRDDKYLLYVKEVEIGDDVVLSYRVTIAPGAKVLDGSFIEAGKAVYPNQTSDRNDKA